MILSEMIGRVQRQFGDESGAQITAIDITRWLNDAQRDIVKRTECLQVKLDIPAVKGQEAYELSNVILLRRVLFNGVRLQRTTLEALDQVTPSRELNTPDGQPRLYYAWGDTLGIYPVAGVEGTLNIMYVKYPKTLGNTLNESPEIPEHMHEDMVRYAVARAKELDQEYGAANTIMADYEFRLNETRQNANQRDIDSYPAIRPLPGDY